MTCINDVILIRLDEVFSIVCEMNIKSAICTKLNYIFLNCLCMEPVLCTHGHALVSGGMGLKADTVNIANSGSVSNK